MGPSPGPPPQTTKGPAALWKPAHSLLSFSFLRVVSLTEAVIKLLHRMLGMQGVGIPLGSRGRQAASQPVRVRLSTGRPRKRLKPFSQIE